MRVALVKNGRIDSVILAESLEDARAITELECVPVDLANPGWVWNEQYGKFLPDQPFDSWTWDNELLSWVAPEPKPESEVELAWDEETLSWVEYVEPAPVFEVPLEPIARMAPTEEETNA